MKGFLCSLFGHDFECVPGTAFSQWRRGLTYTQVCRRCRHFDVVHPSHTLEEAILAVKERRS